mgnify:CR=1 FL=1
MKTTIELPDELVDQARQVARREGTTLRALIEEGLQRSLDARRTAARPPLDFPVFEGSGMTDASRGISWTALRDEIYREPGS